jgi:uncharacterized membrane protein
VSAQGRPTVRRTIGALRAQAMSFRGSYSDLDPPRWLRSAGPVLVAAAIAFNLYFLFPEVRDRPADLNDYVFHSLNLEHAAEAFDAGSDPTDPWVGEIAMGFPIFHYYQHLPYVAPAAVHKVTGIGLATVFQWTAYLLLSFFPVSVYWSMRRLGFAGLEGGMAAFVASLLATDGLFGFDLNSYVWRGWGLYTQLWGMVLLPPAIAQGYVTIREGRGYVLAVVLLVATMLSHLAFGYIALGSLALAVFLRPHWREVRARALRAFVLFALSGVVASYFLLPLLLDSAYLNRSVWEESNKYDSFGANWVLSRLFRGDLFDFGRFPSFTLLAGLGMGVCLLAWRTERFRVPAGVGVLWLLLYFGRPTWGPLFDVTPLARDLHLHRLIAGVHLGGIMLIGVGLAAPWRWASTMPRRAWLLAPAIVSLLLLYPVVNERLDYLRGNDDLMDWNRGQVAAQQNDIDGLLATLEQLPPGRVYAGLAAQWGGNYRVGNVPMYALLTASGVDTLGRLYHSLSLNGDIMVLFDESRPEQYNLFNVRYVVAPRDRTFPDFVKPVGEFGRHRLYQVETTGYFDIVDSRVAFTADKTSFYPAASAWLRSGFPAAGDYPALVFPGQRRPASLPTLPADVAPGYVATPQAAGDAPGAVVSESPGQGRYRATVRVDRPSTVLLKVTYHPGWRAYVDGRRVKPQMLMPSFMGVPVGPGTHDIRFEYHAPGYRLPLLFLGLLVLPLTWVAERRRADLASAWGRFEATRPVAAGRAYTARGAARVRSRLRLGRLAGVIAAASRRARARSLPSIAFKRPRLGGRLSDGRHLLLRRPSSAGQPAEPDATVGLEARPWRFAGLAMALVAVVFNLYFLFPETRSSVLDPTDGVFHFANVRAASDALGAGSDPTDPWVPQFSMGYPVSHHYQHLPYVLPAAIQKVTPFGLDTVFRWTGYLVVSVFPLAMYWSIRRFGFGTLEAGFGALTCGLFSTNWLFGFELNSYTWTGLGLYTQAWGMILLPLAVAQGYHSLREGRGYAWSVLLLAATILSHLVFGVIAAGSVALLAVVSPRRREVVQRARRAGLIFGLTAAVAAYFLAPFWLDRAYFGSSTASFSFQRDSFGASWIMGRLLRGDVFDFDRFPSLTLLAGAGLIISLAWFKTERYRAPIVLGAVWLLLWFGRPTWGAAFEALPLANSLQLHRLVGGVDLAAVLLIGTALALPWRMALARANRAWLLAATFATAAVLAPVYAERVDYLRGNAEAIDRALISHRADQPDLDALFARLATMPPGRIYGGLSSNWGREYGVARLGMYRVIGAYGYDVLGYSYFPWSLNSRYQEAFDETKREHYELFNVRYVIAPRERTFPDFVRPIGDFGRHRLYEVETSGYFGLAGSSVAFRADKSTLHTAATPWLASGFPAAGDYPGVLFPGHDPPGGMTVLPSTAASGYFASAAPGPGDERGAVVSEAVGRGEYRATVQVERPSTVLLKVTYHPGWRAYVDGRRVKPQMLMPSFMGVPVGPGTHDIRFEYHAPGYRLPLLFLGLMVLPLTWVAERRRADLGRWWARLAATRPVTAGRRGWARGAARISTSLRNRVDAMAPAGPAVTPERPLPSNPPQNADASGRARGSWAVARQWWDRFVQRLPLTGWPANQPRWVAQVAAQPASRFLPPLLTVAALAGATLLAGRPLLRLEFMSGDDAFIQLPRVAEYSRALKAGILIPRWSPALESGYGEPTFVLYPPFVYFLPSLWHFAGFNYGAAESLALLCIYFVAAAGMYLLVREFFGRLAGLVAAVVYLWSPWLLITLYLRHNVTDFSGLAYLPLALWGVHCYAARGQYLHLVVGAAATALLILSTLTISLIGLPVLALFPVVAFTSSRQWLSLARGSAVVLAGLGLSAYFWLPVLMETQYVHLERGLGLFSTHFMGPDQVVRCSDGCLRSLGRSKALLIGPVQLVSVIAAAGMLMLGSKLGGRGLPAAAGYFFLVLVSSLFFLSSASSLFWERLPLLEKIQFPWRFLALMAVAGGFLVGATAGALARRGPAACVLGGAMVVVALAFGWNDARPLASAPVDDGTYSAQRLTSTRYQATINHEFEPKWVQQRPAAPAQQKLEVASGAANIVRQDVGQTAYSFTVEASQPSLMRVNTFHFPGWAISVNGVKQTISHDNPQGLMEFYVPAGRNEVTVKFSDTPVRRWGLRLSILSVLVLAMWPLAPRLPFTARVAGWGGRALQRQRSWLPVMPFSRERGAVERWEPEPVEVFAGASGRDRARARLEESWRWFVGLGPAKGLAILIGVALAIRLVLLPLYAYLPGEALDSYAWKRWMEAIDRDGVLNVFRVTRTDYVGYHWVLAALAKVYGWFGGEYVEYPPRPGQYSAFPFGLHALMKAPGILFDLLLIGAVYGATLTLGLARMAKRRVHALALAAAAVAAFHPTVVYDSAVWAQIDAIGAAAMVASLALVWRGRTGAGWAAWALGFLIKPHALVILPILLVLTLDRWEWRRLGIAAAACMGVSAVILGPWVLHGDAGRIIDIYQLNFQGGLYASTLSAGAWNLWWFSQVHSAPAPGDPIFASLPFLTYKLAGLALSVGAAALATLYFIPRRNLERALIAGAYLAVAFYMLPASTHERYMYPFLGLLLPVAVTNRRWLWLYVPLSVTFFLNLFFVAPPIHDWSGRWHESPFSQLVAGCNVLLFAAFTGILVRTAIRGWREGETLAWVRSGLLHGRTPDAEPVIGATWPVAPRARTPADPVLRRAGAWWAQARSWWGRPDAPAEQLASIDTGEGGAASRWAGLRRELPWLAAVLAGGLLAGLPLLRLDWMMGHDELAYLPRHVEFYEGLKAGAWFPRWAPDLGAGYGEPTFNFNPPLLYYLVSAFHAVGFGFVASEDLAILVLLVLSGFGMYFLGREFFGRRGGLVAATAYVFAPFVLSRLYVSHALADFSSFPFLPFAFWCTYRYAMGGRYRWLAGAGASIAGITLTSLSVTAMAFPALILFVGWLAVANRDIRVAVRGGGALVLACALAAFFLVPALMETKYVHIDRREERLDFHDHFLYFRQLVSSRWGWGLSGPGPNDGMSFAVGPLYIAGTVAALVMLRPLRAVSREAALAVIAFLVMVAVCVFLMTSPSLFVWERVGALHPLQFPWRFLQLVALATAFLLGAPFVLLRARPRAANALLVALVAGLLLFGLQHSRPRGYLDLDEADFSAANIAAKGIPATAREFEPIWVEQFPRTPRAEHLTIVEGAGNVLTSDVRAFDRSFLVQVERPSLVRINTFYFPGWKVYVDGTRRSVAYDHLPNGLMEFYLQPGIHTVRVKFEDTAVRKWSTRLSVFTLAGLVLAPAGLAVSRRIRVRAPEREQAPTAAAT